MSSGSENSGNISRENAVRKNTDNSLDYLDEKLLNGSDLVTLMAQPLKNKILQFEQDYIETEIKWNLKLGDDIFKKIEVTRAVRWLKSEIKNNPDNKKTISLYKLNKLLNEAFYDVIKRNNKK